MPIQIWTTNLDQIKIWFDYNLVQNFSPSWSNHLSLLVKWRIQIITYGLDQKKQVYFLNSRFDKGTLELLHWYEAIFGREMWDYVIIETTFWSHRQHDAEKRKKHRKLTEEKVKSLLMKELKSLNITSQGTEHVWNWN